MLSVFSRILFASAVAGVTLAQVPFASLSSGLTVLASDISALSTAILAYPTTSIPTTQGLASYTAFHAKINTVLSDISSAVSSAAQVTPTPLASSQGSVVVSILATRCNPPSLAILSRLDVLKRGLVTLTSALASTVSGDLVFLSVLEADLVASLVTAVPAQFSSSISSAGAAATSAAGSAIRVYN